MDGSTKGGGADNPSPGPPAAAGGAAGDGAASSAPAAAAGGRRPFTSLSQEEADLALARVLQEQERAYMLLSVHGGGGEYASSYSGSYDYDEEEEEEEEEEGSDYEDEEGEGEALDEDEQVGGAEGAQVYLDRALFTNDEAYAFALRAAREREVSGRIMALAGFRDWRPMEEDDDEEEEEDGDPQGAWEDVEPEEYSYEELLALGELVGTESKGLSADTIASLPSVTYQAQEKQDGNMEQCVICRVEFEEGESLVGLPCKHSYHSECINQWLQLNKVCPMCSSEVSTSVNKRA
ncbi:hypothetical protein ACP70R_001322 [Stipagrostis hirtigluma subsp. patula]